MTPASGSRFRLFEADDLSRWGVAVLALAYTVTIAVAFLTNVPCLFFSWDGASWEAAIDTYRAYSISYWMAQVTPLQGLFDLNYHAYRGGIPQLLFWPGPRNLELSRFTTFFSYALMLSAAIFFLGRTVGFRDRKSVV